MASDKTRSDGQTISRAVAILKVLAERPGASFGQIAAQTGLPRSTVQRLIGVLNQEGLVTKAFGQPGAYLGMELARLGARVRLDARALLRPFIEDLHARIGDNIDLTTLQGDRVFVVEQVASNEAIRVISYVGLEHPIHCTANGKAHLSMLPRERALELLRGPLKVCTPRTVTDPQAILRDIEASRATGVFVDDEEYSEGASAMAVPLPRFGDDDFALSIAMPAQRFARLRDEVAAALLAVREKIVAEYGKSI
ncbi:MAG: IclR family transcriptional regulator [Rhodobacter sp.]|nr:IclR family transcriptional regulator [Paracoccaceae bacterium]MCC0076547.1 IclR family transcriptional regulator [Rhodobacter sp.]